MGCISFPALPYPARWGGVLQTYYDFDSSVPIYTIKQEKNKMIPRDDKFTFYIGYISGVCSFLIFFSFFGQIEHFRLLQKI